MVVSISLLSFDHHGPIFRLWSLAQKKTRNNAIMLQIEELFSEQTFPISLLITTTFIFERNANYPLGHR